MMTKNNQTPQIGDSAIMYGVACKVENVTMVRRYRRVKKVVEPYDQVMIHLDPGLPEPLVLEVEKFYRLKTGEWTTPGRLLSREERRKYRVLTGGARMHPSKHEGGEAGARIFIHN